MRRGLMAWDADEIPLDVLQQRVQRLQDVIAAAGLDGLLLYTNFIRSGAVSFVTAFSPYWADGVLLVPRQGEPVFATTLSTRVASWIQSVKPIGDVVTSPTPCAILGKRLAAGGVKRLAILERDAFPGGLHDELLAALPDVEFSEGAEIFAAARGHLDQVERSLLLKADAIARDGLATVGFETENVGAAIGAVEKYARLQGSEEVYVAIAPDLDADCRFLRLSGDQPLGPCYAIRATVAYKGTWTRRIQTYSRDGEDRLPIARADAWFKSFVAGIDKNRSLHDQIAAGLKTLPGAQPAGWMAEAAMGTRPLNMVASSEDADELLQHVPALVLTLGLTIDDMPWCGAGLACLGVSA